MKLGFEFVPFPREIWEGRVSISGQAMLLLGWFLCDLKLGITASTYSDSDILKGVNKRPGVNLSRNAMKSAREELVKLGFLQFSDPTGGAGRGDEKLWIYRLKVSITDTITASKNSEKVSITDTPIRKEEIVDLEVDNFYLRPDEKPSLQKGTRIPDNFMYTAEHIHWAAINNLPHPGDHIEAFKDYWIAKPGRGGTKLDWDATFRNWIRNAAERNGNGHHAAKGSVFERAVRKYHAENVDELAD